MLERTSKIHFDDILESDIVFNQDSNFGITKKIVRKRAFNANSTTTNKPDEALDDHIMTRKTRTRTPRIPAIQSGYCAVCNVPYNSVEDHIQSKKHQKLIGEDANYIALNGSLNGFLHTNSIPFLNLNGVDAIGVHETSLEDFTPPQKRRNMRRTRAASVMSDRHTKKLTPLSPTNSDKAGHCLRSRRNINYMTPPLDDDSLLETPEITAHNNEEPPLLEHPPAIPQHDYKEYRELRSSTRALAKLTEPEPELQEEVWNSGRPKRACIRQKRISLDDRLSSSNFKTFYKVEVLTSKVRSNKDNDRSKRHQSQSPKREGDDSKDKGLIVKFKKLRNAELTRLNNEATNFLFPKRDDNLTSDSEETDGDVNSNSGTVDDNALLNSCSSDIEVNSNKKSNKKYIEEDDASMDSNCSNKKKKRRTHAEAFIRDNQKYYKFETPGSSCCRLRYHGSYLAPLPKSPKHNGDHSACKLETIKKEEPEDVTEIQERPKSTFDRSKYKFSFENVPVNSFHYAAFMRQDQGQQKYFHFSDDAYWGDSFLLPYQMPFIKPLDPKKCINRFKEALKALREKIHVPECEDNSACATPELNATSSSTPSTFAPEQDDDSKMSGLTQSSACNNEGGEDCVVVKKRRNRRSKAELLLQTNIIGNNPRKSPRQHASTLAILSSFLQQRKRRSRNKNGDEANQSLATIPEEESLTQEAPVVQKPRKGRKFKGFVKPKVETPKIDYAAIARQIDDELDTVLDSNLEEFDLDIDEENAVDFHNTKPNLRDIMALYEESKAKESVKSCKRFLSGCPPGRKPGRKKKKNKTGWPNKSRRLVKRAASREKEEENDGSTIDSVSVNNDSDDEICDDDETNNVTDCSSINKNNDLSNKSDQCVEGDDDNEEEEEEEDNCDVDRVDDNKNDKILTNKVTNNGELQLQPFVIVQKLGNKIVAKKSTAKRSKRARRFVPGSPKSPRALRKPRGRWYKER